MTRKFAVSTSSGEYAVCVGSGLSRSLSKRLYSLFGKERKGFYIVTSPEIWSLWGKR
jgi:3-dehydroquinate synthase